MKTLKITLLLSFLFPVIVSAQTLLETYKTGKVKLLPDPTYAQNVNWDRVFASYHDTLYGRWKGDDKVLTILPDGSAVVSHAYKNFYTRFDANGRFVEEFGVSRPGGNNYRSLKHVQGVLNNKILFTGLDNMGNMLCFDFKGNLVKTLKMDYMAKQIIALPNNKLALVGWVLWSNKIREFVAIIDYETNEEKIIWDHFSDRNFVQGTHRFNYMYSFKDGGMVSFSTMPFVRALGMSHPPMIASVGNHIIIAIPETGEIRKHDLNGKFISSQKIDWAKGNISVEEQKEIQKKAIAKYRSMKSPQFVKWASNQENCDARDYFIQEMEKDLQQISEPIPMPYFSNLMKDSDDNLLFFEFPKEKGANVFNVWVYENNGKFVAKSSFVTKSYGLEIKPSKMVFHNGYIYALQEKKDATGVPLRMVRFRVEAE
ncbi:MAG TPA: hypothetical protein ENN08_01925 [Bacteroidales bacterium]|nr:hypothetical protein [Bacteroidales bacterium]